MRTSDPPVPDVPAESPRVTSATAAADPGGEDGGEERDDNDASPRGRLRPNEAERGSRLVHERAAARLPLGGILRHGAREYLVDGGGNARPTLAGARRLLLEVGVHDRDVGGAGERERAGERLEQEAAERVHVGTSVHLSRRGSARARRSRRFPSAARQWAGRRRRSA